MVYNTMELGGVPWETLIKEYRKHLKKKKFNYLEEYVDNFFKFLSGNERLFNEEHINYFNEEHIKDVLLLILIRFFSSFGDISSNRKAKEIFNKQIKEMEKLDFADSFDENLTRLTNGHVYLFANTGGDELLQMR